MAQTQPTITSVKELKDAVAELIRILDQRLIGLRGEPERIQLRRDWIAIKERFGLTEGETK